MHPQINIDAWKRDGEQLWAKIQERKLVVIFWRNPWFRFAVIGSAPLIAAIATWIIWRNYLLSGVLAVVSLPFIYSAIKFYTIGVRTGGLYSFFSETGFGIGCDADRLSIPYSAIQLPNKVSPGTVNDNFIVLPVKSETTGVLIERKDGKDSPWDGKPYKRGIASVSIRDGSIQVKAYPNEMIVHLFCAIYPLSMFLTSRPPQGSSPNGGPVTPPANPSVSAG